jgi:hypothetical protein
MFTKYRFLISLFFIVSLNAGENSILIDSLKQKRALNSYRLKIDPDKENERIINFENEPIHALNRAAMEAKATGREIEKKVSKSIRQLIFLPHFIDIKTKVKTDEINTYFIYEFEE